MPAFPERESSLLSKLHQTAPWTAKLHQEGSSDGEPSPERARNTVANGPTEPPPVEPVESLISTGGQFFLKHFIIVYGHCCIAHTSH